MRRSTDVGCQSERSLGLPFSLLRRSYGLHPKVAAAATLGSQEPNIPSRDGLRLNSQKLQNNVPAATRSG